MMLQASTRFLDGLRASHTVLADATIIQHDGTEIPFDVISGDITIDGRRNVWRQATVTLTNPDARLLGRVSVADQLRVRRGIRYFDHTVEWVTVGLFWVQEVTQAYPAQTITVTAFDAGAKIDDYRLVTPYVPINQAGTRLNSHEAVVDLLHIADPGAAVNFDSGTWNSSQVPPGTVFTGSRWDALQSLAKGLGAIVHADVDGSWRVHKVDFPGSPVWQVNAGYNGVLVSTSSIRSRREQYNAVPVRWETPSGGGLLFLTDSDPASPTLWGGPFGRKPADEVSLGTITSEAEATAAAVALLAQYKGFTRSLSFDAITNPLLEPLDVVRVSSPDGYEEDHVIDAIQFDLAGGVMSCETRMIRTTDARLVSATGVEA